MNKERLESPALSDVLNEFVMAVGHPTRMALEAWIRKYPHFRHELVDFVSSWVAEETLPEPAPLTIEEENLIVNRAMSQVENLLFQNDKASEPVIESINMPLNSLIQSASKVGVDVAGLANACQLDRILIVKLEARQIQSRSIPMRLIEMIAQALKRRADEVLAFTAQPPRLIPGASYMSRDTPQVSAQEPFANAVQQSSLSQDIKDNWLAESASNSLSD